jgi:hypothetical protein
MDIEKINTPFATLFDFSVNSEPVSDFDWIEEAAKAAESYVKACGKAREALTEGGK